jgi:hypothetical protein
VGSEPSLDRDVELLQTQLGGPRLTLITTSIVVVERCDRPGWECPVTGSHEVRALSVQDDLSFLVNNETKERTNRWALDPDGQDEYDDLCSEAVPYLEAAANSDPFWHVPIVWTVGDTEVEDLIDDETQTIYWSGGWRSSKTYRLLRWWQRGWCKYGRVGERFWLCGPEIINAWRLYEKAFIGSAQVPPLFPSLQPGLLPSFLLDNGPSELSYDRRKLSGRLCDGAIAEQYHLKGQMGHVEGESVRRVAYDEAASSKDARGYGVLRGRVMQCRGQVGISSVPDEDCEWLYSGVVAEYEKHGCHQPRVMTHFEKERPLPRTRIKPRQVKVRLVSIYDNPYIEDEALDRALEGETDPVAADNKFRGLWTRRGQHAYIDVWSPDRYTRDELSDRAEAWGLGPDITPQVVLECFNRPTRSGYGGYVDFSEGGDKPQSRGWFKVFGHFDDWESWNLVFLDEESTRSDALQASAESARRKKGRYLHSALVGDSNGFHKTNREGGSGQKHNAAKHWENAGFEMVAVIRTVKHGKAAYSLPLLGESRTVVRDVMRRGKLWVNAGACPGIVNALVKAPNRRKKNSDKNTWIEKQIYGHEDGVRYVCHRLFSKRLERRTREFQEQIEQGTG